MRRSGLKLGLGLPVRVRRAATLVTALVALLVLLGVLLASPVAEARSGFESGYGFERTYNAALRLIRIDMGLKITEKDDKTGYIVFDYKSADVGNKVSSGSIEFVRSNDADGPVSVVVQLSQMPRYHEQVLVDSLVRKMRQDYGEPPERKKPAPAPEKPAGDAGTDGDAETTSPSN
jgi:hypothetical protein